MSDNVQETTNDTAQAAAQAAAQTAAHVAPTPADMPQQTTQPAEPNTIDSLPDWVQAHIKELREENAKHRNKAKTAAEEATQREQQHAAEARNALVQDIAKALGLAEDEQDPQQLLNAANEKTEEQQKRIDELVSTLNDYKRRDAVQDAVGDRKVNTKLLHALLQLDNDYTSVDPNSDGYADQVSEAVNKVIDANPEIVQGTRGQSGIDPTNTRNGEKSITRDDLKTMSAEDINKAVRDGRLDHILKSN